MRRSCTATCACAPETCRPWRARVGALCLRPRSRCRGRRATEQPNRSRGRQRDTRHAGDRRPRRVRESPDPVLDQDSIPRRDTSWAVCSGWSATALPVQGCCRRAGRNRVPSFGPGCRGDGHDRCLVSPAEFRCVTDSIPRQLFIGEEGGPTGKQAATAHRWRCGEVCTASRAGTME